MSYSNISRQNRRRAEALLKVLKGKLVDASRAIEQATTMQAATSSRHWRLSKVSGVHLYEAREGWFADLAFKDLPGGVPALIGNAVPCKTRQAAVESAVRQLSLCAEREKVALPNSNIPLRWFVFDEVEVPVDPAYLPGVKAKLAHEGYTMERALGELTYLRHVISGDEPMTQEAVKVSNDEIQERLAMVCEMALALGQTQFSVDDGVWSDYAPSAPGPMH